MISEMTQAEGITHRLLSVRIASASRQQLGVRFSAVEMLTS
jgi:hypothetical protein